MSEPLVTQDQIEGVMRLIRALGQRIGRVEVREKAGYGFGTFTPTLVGSTIAGVFTYLVSAGDYTRLGNTVFVRGRIALSVVTTAPTGNLSINGLPFTAATVISGSPGGASFSFWSKVGLGGGAKVYLGGWIQNNQSKIDLYVSDNAGGVVATLTGATAAVANGTDMTFFGAYQVA